MLKLQKWLKYYEEKNQAIAINSKNDDATKKILQAVKLQWWMLHKRNVQGNKAPRVKFNDYGSSQCRKIHINQLSLS